MKTLWTVFVTIGLLFVVASPARALVVNCGTVSGPTELTGASILCPQFNGPGTLQDISIAISGTITGSLTFHNTSTTASESAMGTNTSDFSVGSLAGFTFANPLFSANFSSGLRTISPGQTLTIQGLTGSGNATIVDTTIFSPYIGAGNFSIPISTDTLVQFGGGGHIVSSQTTSASATAVVTYDLAPTTAPEPGSILLLSTGLAAVLATRRRGAAR